MELRHLRYFVALSEEMSFTRAANRLRIAQPGLSIQIRNLEDEVGVPLVSREGRKIKLTAAGEVFLAQAQRTLNDAERAIALTRLADGGDIGNLYIGHNGVSELLILPKIVPAFRKRWPSVHLSFQNLRPHHQLEKLRREELDLAYVLQSVSPDEFDAAELLHVPLVAVLPEDHRLTRQPDLSIKDLSEEPLVLFQRNLDTDSFHEIEQLFAHSGASMNVIYEFDKLLSVMNFVAMGCGCSILPDYQRRILGGVVYRPIRPPNIVKTLSVIKKKGRGDLAERFYRFSIDAFTPTRIGPTPKATQRAKP